MIIDSHCHAGKGDGLTGPWDTAAPLDAYLRRAASAGIEKTVLLPAFHSNYRVANREVARIVRRDPRRFYGYAMVHPSRDAGRVDLMVREAVERWGFRGIKVHRHDARITREICETARRLAVPILYDVMGEASGIDLIAPEYPDVSFIIPHLGSFSDDWRAQRVVVDQLGRYPNVHADTSGVRRFDLLVEAVAAGGPEKILFGTDGPWLHPAVELSKVYALGLSPSDEALVLGGNLERLISGSRAAAPGPRPATPVTRRSEGVGTSEVRDPWAGAQFPVV
jgi:uncharacterized protein